MNKPHRTSAIAKYKLARFKATLLVAGCIIFLTSGSVSSAAEWYVSPSGKPNGRGTKAKPWDITSALGGQQDRIAPGDTVWIRGGTYRHPFENAGKGFPVHLAGSKGAAIQIRGYKGERATIDGGLNILSPSTYLWVRDLEVTVTDPRPKGP